MKVYYDDIGWLPESPDRIASPKRFGKGPLISAGVQKGWPPKKGYLRVLSDVILVYGLSQKLLWLFAETSHYEFLKRAMIFFIAIFKAGVYPRV